jgi:hypothetical protein
MISLKRPHDHAEASAHDREIRTTSALQRRAEEPSDVLVVEPLVASLEAASHFLVIGTHNDADSGHSARHSPTQQRLKCSTNGAFTKYEATMARHSANPGDCRKPTVWSSSVSQRSNSK